MVVIDYFLSLGSTVFVPIVLILIGLFLGQGILSSIRSGITVGIGFIGLGLAISLISNTLEPAVNQIVERFSFNLTVIDIGSGAAAGVAFSSLVGALIIPSVFVLNLLLLLIGFTKTMNIDIFNYSHYAFTGAVVHLITGSVVLGVGTSLIQATWSLLSADYSARKVQDALGVDGISIPQGYASSTVPLFSILDKVYDRIPFLRDSKLDLSHLQGRVGLFGDPVIIGAILGIILALLAGYNFADGTNLLMGVVAIMVLFPRMVKIIVEGLLPISEAAKGFFNKRFNGKEVFIGLDSAVTLGLPTTQIVGTMLIPITLVLAVILPGNKVLPLGDLAFVAFFTCMATIIHKGNILKTIISGVINMIGVLYIASWFAPYFSKLAANSGATEIKGQTTALWNGNVFDIIIANIGRFGIIGLIILIVITIPIGLYVKRVSSTPNSIE
ncbi:PTS transporter subunit IIC [Siminovitchia fortis]|uniref:PTS galactitol transporter subunit IIC n=1 Tax=Siminovitchia fortis TaxID=254758 RepID=A0A443IVP6_9BACI|nr:PTS transporter subunit IIC [Siminovitchia fortis]RWR12161.1 PTS galactitol transporter subunit IIC [Siminovitchia fortis]WHY81004.1 PTS transporter subunit IIC [Siminovitchia fortis]